MDLTTLMGQVVRVCYSHMGVDNFFVVGGGGLCCHAQFCDHSYLLLDYHHGSGVLVVL